MQKIEIGKDDASVLAMLMAALEIEMGSRKTPEEIQITAREMIEQLPTTLIDEHLELGAGVFFSKAQKIKPDSPLATAAGRDYLGQLFVALAAEDARRALAEHDAEVAARSTAGADAAEPDDADVPLVAAPVETPPLAAPVPANEAETLKPVVRLLETAMTIGDAPATARSLLETLPPSIVQEHVWQGVESFYMTIGRIFPESGLATSQGRDYLGALFVALQEELEKRGYPGSRGRAAPAPPARPPASPGGNGAAATGAAMAELNSCIQKYRVRDDVYVGLTRKRPEMHDGRSARGYVGRYRVSDYGGADDLLEFIEKNFGGQEWELRFSRSKISGGQEYLRVFSIQIASPPILPKKGEEPPRKIDPAAAAIIQQVAEAVEKNPGKDSQALRTLVMEIMAMGGGSWPVQAPAPVAPPQPRRSLLAEIAEVLLRRLAAG